MEKLSLLFCHKLLLRKICLWDVGFTKRNSVQELEDKPVGGMKTGPTRHGMLGLAHKPIINFLFLQKPKI